MVFGEAEEEAGGYGDETIGMGMLGKAGSKIRLASDDKSKRAFPDTLLILLPKLNVLTLSPNDRLPSSQQSRSIRPTDSEPSCSVGRPRRPTPSLEHQPRYRSRPFRGSRLPPPV